MRESFVSLGDLYSRLEAELGVEGNPCGDCTSCCQATGMAAHKVSDLELHYLDEMVGVEKTNKFRSYIARESDSEGQLLYEVCPNHNGSFCSVHEFRPYSCRLYGKYRTDTQSIFPHCVFKDSVKVIPSAQEQDLLPEHKALKQLQLDDLMYHGSGSDSAPVDILAPALDSDPLMLASFCLTQGDFQGAIAHYESADTKSFSGSDYWSLGQAYQGLSRHQESIAAFDKALQMEPENPIYHLARGGLLFDLQDWQGAAQNLQRAVEFNPGRAMSHGLLGVCLLFQGEIESAVKSLEECIRCETEPTVFRLQLAQIYQNLGQQQRAREMYELAKECSITEEAAQAALAALGP